MASLCELLNSWRVGHLWKRRVKMQIGIISVRVDRIRWFRRSLVNNRNRVGDRRDTWGTPLLMDSVEERWPLKWSYRKDGSRWRGSLKTKALCQTLLKTFHMSEIFTKFSIREWPRHSKKTQKITSRTALTEPMLTIREKFGKWLMFKRVDKNFLKRQKIKEIRW